MNKNAIMTKISGGGYSLIDDFHPPPACLKDTLKPL